jgi:uncharacterized protein (DUF1697 family)
MPKHIAFLRAINVGGHTVKMDHLRTLFEAAGFRNVETFIASGNVIFDSKSTSAMALERKIEKHLHQSLGYEVATFIRTLPELVEIARYTPFPDVHTEADTHTVYIGFLGSAPNKEAEQKLISAATPVDDFHICRAEVYWLCRTTFGQSLFSGARLEKCLGMQTTLRNSNTVRRLVAKYSPG